MVLESFKKFIKRKLFDTNDTFIKSSNNPEFTDTPEGVEVIEPNISYKNAFDPKDLFKKKKKVKS